MKYLIQSVIEKDMYVEDGIHDEVLFIHDIDRARRFDSMTEAELFALENRLRRYTIVPINEPAPYPLPTHDIGESGA